MIKQIKFKIVFLTINLFLLINAQSNELIDELQLSSNEILSYSSINKGEFINYNQIKDDNQSQRNQIPNNFTVEVLSSNSVRLKWLPPISKEIAVLQYKIKYEKLNSNKLDTITLDSKINNYQIENLDSDSEYRFKIIAVFVNDHLGPSTKWKQIQTLKELDETRVPDKPEFLLANGKSTKIHLKWSPPLNRSIRIREYFLNFGVNFPDINHLTIDVNKNEYVIKDLQPKQEYVISLRASNKFGAGEAIYATAKTTTKDDDDLIADEIDEDGEDETNQDDDKLNNLDENKQISVPKLDSDTDVDLNKKYETDSELLPPLGVKATPLSSHQIRVSWTESSSITKTKHNNENKKDHSYLVKYNSLIDKVKGKVKYLNTTENQILIDDLKPFTKYEFAVKMIKRNSASTWSMSAMNITNEALPASAPRDLIVMPVSNLVDPLLANKITNDLNINQNNDDLDNKLNELPIYTGSSASSKQMTIKKAKSAFSKNGKYRNKIKNNSKQPYTSKHTYSGDLDREEILENDLDEDGELKSSPNSQNYVQTISEINKQNLDQESDKIKESTNNLPDKQVLRGLSAVSLSWQPAKQVNGETLGYLISYNRNGTKDWAIHKVHGDVRSTVVHNLLPETVYYFKAQVRNKKGIGPYSNPVQFKTTLSDNSSVSTNTLYVIIAIISSISLLLLVVISSLLLCKNKKNLQNPVIGNNIYSDSPLATKRRINTYNYIPHSPLSASNTLKLNKNRDFPPPDLWINHDPIELNKLDKNQLNEELSITATPILQRMETFLGRDPL